MGVLLYSVYSEEGSERAGAPPSHLLAVPTHQRPVYQSLYCLLLWAFNAAIKGSIEVQLNDSRSEI